MNPSYFPQPDILQELAGKNRVVIEASAGTGKTFTLEHLFVDLILSRGVGVDEILVVTYTEKATGELKLRLRKKLEQLASHEGGTKPSGPQSAWEIDPQARERLRAAVAAFDTASISTIHSFCQRVLSEHAFASGRLFEEQLLRGSEALARTFRQVLRETLATDTKKQLLVATYLGQGRPLEHVETLLVQALQHRGTLALRFDEKAVEDFASAFPVSETFEQDLRAEMEIKGRVHARSRERVLRQTVSFARAVEAFRREGNVFELVAHIEDSSGADCLAKLREELAELYLAFPEPTVGHRVGRALDGLGHSPSLDAALVAHFLPLVRVRLEQSKRELGLCDFDDMLLLVREALRGPGREGLIQSLRSRYRVALIDEFQDTDEVQWEIFRTLFVDGAPSHGVFLIGDPKQAIYGFRGGDVATYLEARDYLLRHGGHAVRLGHNFRSTADVIEGYNRILKQTSPLPFFRGGITYDVPVEAGQNHIRTQGKERGSESAANAAAMVFLDVPANLGDAKARRSALHEAIAKEIVHLLRQVPPPLTIVDARAPHRPPRALRAQDIFILTGTAREGAAVAEALRAEGIPYSLFKEAGLFRSDEAQAVATLLDALADPTSRSKRRKAYLTPFFAIPLEDILEADEQPAHQPLPRLFQRLCQLADQPDKAPLVSAALDETGLAKRLLFEGDSRSLTNYTHLFELLLEETRNGARTMDDLRRAMRAFLSGKRRPVAQDEDEKRLDTDEDAVQILTMHKSKGLEAEVVFLAGGFGRKPGQDVIYHDDGARVRVVGFPFDGEKDKALEERDAEDRRVIYVALTRPKSRLYLPRFGKPDKGKRLDISGVYGCLQERLEAMAEEGGLLEPPIFDQTLVKAARPSRPSRSTPSTKEAQGDAMAAEAAPASIPGDAPGCSGEASPPTWLPAEKSSDALYESIRSRCSGLLVSSYSQLKRRNTSAGGLALEPDRHLEIRGTDDVLPLERASDDLPGGTATGLFLHAVLEHIPFDEVNQASDAASLLTSPTIRPIFERSAALFGVSTECLPRAAELVFGALNHPLRLGIGAQTTVRLGQASRILRELEFTYPIPEKHHPSLGAPSPSHLDKGVFSIDRGLLRGFIDLVFEFDGKVYVLDWKSDRLAHFHRQHIRAHVSEHYALQARIYLLALVRFLRIREETEYERRLGGAVYVFLRAMGSLVEPDYGVYSLRPSWGELCQWERELGTHPAFPTPSQRLGDQP